MELTVIRKHGKNEIYGIVEGMGTMLVNIENLHEPVKKDYVLEGYRAGGSFVAERIIRKGDNIALTYEEKLSCNI